VEDTPAGLLTDGPSPRTWGERRWRIAEPPRRRTIPTHVGRTDRVPLPSQSLPDHPHARGENGCGAASRSRSLGPSPRTWGEPVVGPFAHRDRRTIPTHVGRTHHGAAAITQKPDHPHARGENASIRPIPLPRHGPSPRTWGELPSASSEMSRQRTIPTHVGRTRTSNPRESWVADHPHARGENVISVPSSHRIPGPSPRTWGELP